MSVAGMKAVQDSSSIEEGVKKKQLNYHQMALELKADIEFLECHKGLVLDDTTVALALTVLDTLSDAVDNISLFENSLGKLYRKGNSPIWGKLGEYASYTSELGVALVNFEISEDLVSNAVSTLKRFKNSAKELTKNVKVYAKANEANQSYLKKDNYVGNLLPFVFRYTYTDSASVYSSPTPAMLNALEKTENYIDTCSSKLKINKKEIGIYELLIGDVPLLGRALDSGAGLFSSIEQAENDLPTFFDLVGTHFDLIYDIMDYLMHPLFLNKKFSLPKSFALSLFLERLRFYCETVESYMTFIASSDKGKEHSVEIEKTLRKFINLTDMIIKFKGVYGGKPAPDTKIVDNISLTLLDKIETLMSYNGKNWHHSAESIDFVKGAWDILSRYRRLINQRGSTVLLLHNLLSAKHAYYLTGYITYTVLIYSDVALGRINWETNLPYQVVRATLNFVPEYGKNDTKLVVNYEESYDKTPIDEYLDEDKENKDGLGFWSSKLEYNYVKFVDKMVDSGFYECPVGV